MIYRVFWAVLVCLAVVGAAEAGHYRVGYRDVNGYVFTNDGYWSYGGNLYYRTAYESPGYWSCGAYYPGAISYSYSLYTPPTPVVAVPAVTAPDFWERLAKYKAGQKESELRLQALREAGYLTPQLQLPGYGLSGYGQGYSNTASFYGANASTLYAYNSQQAIYNAADLLALYQMANQHTLNAQALAGTGAEQFKALVQLESNNRAEIARIVAKRDLAIAILKSLDGPNSITQSGYKVIIGSNGGTRTDDSQVPADTRTKIADAWKVMATAKCGKCHSGAALKAKFNILDYPGLSAENQDVVIARLTTAEPKDMMPRDPDDDTKPGMPLTAAQIQLFVALKTGEPKK